MLKHILDLNYSENEQLEKIFKTIYEGNAILFLGAGASVTAENRFLSKDIIEFFEDKKGISWKINDIVEFVDALSNNENYSREEFDNYVDECLRKLNTTEAHHTIATTFWRLIITTNYDLLVEKAFAKVEGTHEEVGKLKLVRTQGEYHGIQARDEIKYVKLHGCLSDKRKYKLAFSSDDFRKAVKFYKAVLGELRNLSDNVIFLSAGYSYSDDFAKRMLEQMDATGFRERRVIYNIDPYVNDAVLPTYTSKRICVIKASMKNFFEVYEEWKNKKDNVGKQFPKIHFTNHENSDIYIPAHISKRIGDNLRQLNSYYRSRIIAESEFYRGGEPDFNIILKHYDVIKTAKIAEIKDFIYEQINNVASRSRLIPIFFLTGTFGTGKSTFAYRLLNELNRQEVPTVSFEIIDPSELQTIDLKEIFSKAASSHVFVYINTVDVNSVFKSVLDLRNRLSIEGSADIKVVFLVTIRENILLKYKADKQITNSFDVNIDCPFNKQEVEELVEKLNSSEIVQYRDAKEKSSLIKKISDDFNGDSFVSLLELVQGNRLIEDLLQAYHELNEKCRKAFVYTSVLYQYKLLMPSGLLRHLVSPDWEAFRSDVIERDGKGILIQQVVGSKGTDPDLYFRTKHPVISRKLVKSLLADEDQFFNHVKSIVTHLIAGFKNSKLTIDFFKAIIHYKDLPTAKIDHLYDLADEHVGEDAYFLLHYAINLQKRQNEVSIVKAISKIQYAESISDKSYRNHFLIHRRGVLNFELAKLIHSTGNKNRFYKVLRHIEEAREFLEIKRAYDPFSSFSYTSLLELEIWCLSKFEETQHEKLKRRIVIEELFDKAIKTVFENVSWIYDIKNRYVSRYKFEGNEENYLDFLYDYAKDSVSRPYALILLFNHFLAQENFEKCEEFLFELESMDINSDVLNLLFKYYGRNLSDTKIRLKFFDLIKVHPELEDKDNLRFNYFNFIAECYNRNFSHAHQYLTNIRETFHHINPDFHQVWVDAEAQKPSLFEATLRKNKFGKKQFYISELNLWVKPENWDRKWTIQMQFDVELHFYVYGIRAMAINIITEEYEDDEDGSLNEELEL